MEPTDVHVSWSIDIARSDVDDYLMMNNMPSRPDTRRYAAARLAYDSIRHSVEDNENHVAPPDELALVFTVNGIDVDFADPAPY